MKKHQSIEEKLWQQEVDEYVCKTFKATVAAIAIGTVVSLSVLGVAIWLIVKTVV